MKIEMLKIKRNGFTLVEMLVAMAVTLLMMTALARAFGFVGESVRDSRADVEMSGRLTDMNARLSSELKRCTTQLAPATDGTEPLGYFLYSEGPVTDVTSSLFRATTDTDGNLALDDARYGDFDDYLAFTTVAEGDNWFTGKVPRFVLDAKTAELNPTAHPNGYVTGNFPGNPTDPVVITSKYAEIIYFVSPEYVANSLPGNPAFIDADGNGLPDRLRLHRRVLLIRPDLNLATGNLPVYATPATPSVYWMRPDDWPIGNANTLTILGNGQDNGAWQYAMANVHQQCDLSVRRVVDAQGRPLNSNGQATALVAANSLADLSKPENRFAHVRIPGSILTGSGGIYPTSMPVLSLGGPPPVLNAVNNNANAQLPPPLAPLSNIEVVTPNNWSGFIRPEFVLGSDLVHRETSGRNRLGEDVLANNVLGMDAQIYDPEAWSFTTSAGLVVGPNDAGYREAVLEQLALANQNPSTFNAALHSRGDFVDLAYPVLAGGSVRGWQQRLLDSLDTSTNPLAIGATGRFLETPFSGVTVATNNYDLSNSLFKSGRLVWGNNTDVRLFQPAYDTYTMGFETDGTQQAVVAAGTLWGTNTSPLVVDQGADGIDNNGLYGADDVAERETLPPFTDAARAIRVTIRIENPSTRQVRQASVVQRD